MAIDNSGNVFVTGPSYAGDSYDYTTVNIARQFLSCRMRSISSREFWSTEACQIFFEQHQRIDIPVGRAAIIEVDGTASPEPVTKFRFRTEAFTTGFPLAGFGYSIELYNFVTQNWEVFERPASAIDRGEVVEITANPERFIEPGTRRMRSRLSWLGHALLFPNWSSQIDQTIWLIDR
ncbi:MAG: hypothetical protein ACR2HJ_10520 [Fimbriimonadales bacterium]